MQQDHNPLTDEDYDPRVLREASSRRQRTTQMGTTQLLLAIILVPVVISMGVLVLVAGVNNTEATDRDPKRPLPERVDQNNSSAAGPTGYFVPIKNLPALPEQPAKVTKTIGVDVEDGLTADATSLVDVAEDVLTDRRGWTSAADVGFVFRKNDEIAQQTAHIRFALATKPSFDAICHAAEPHDAGVCYRSGQVVIDSQRWMLGSQTYPDLAEYRRYLLNHGLGLAFGFSARACPKNPAAATVMVVQTLDRERCAQVMWPTRERT